MTQVIINPEEARRFARALTDRSHAIQERKRAITNAFEQLQGVWRDQRYHQFSRLFEDSNRMLDDFTRTADRCAEYLKKKAAKIDIYLGHH